MHMEARGVLEGDALKQDVLALVETHQVVAHGLLCLGRSRYIGQAVLHLPRIPEVALLGDLATHAVILFPLDVAHLGALHRPPLLSVAVDDTLAGDGNVAALGGLDAGVDTARRAVLVDIEPLVG